MSIPVWIWPVEYPVKVSLKIDESQIDLGGGIVKTIQHELAFENADGTGQIRSRKGTFVFTVQVTRKNFHGDEKFKAIMRFLQARKWNGNESFYFYNPAEQLVPDPSGQTANGRYLVKHLEELSASLTKLTLWDFADLVFTEDRS